MAKHYYNIEFVMSETLDEDEIQELDELIVRLTGAVRVSIEYVDSEG